MTAFLTLIFILFISSVGSLMEAASIQIAKSCRRVDMNCAMESIFAEYQKELLEEFEVFGLEGSYETGEYSEKMVLERLAYYGATGMQNRIQAIQLLPDEGGKPFREQVKYYIESKYGDDFLGQLATDSSVWEKQESSVAEIEKHSRIKENTLEALLKEYEVKLPIESNPLPNIQTMIKRPLLELVMPEERQLSNNTAELSAMLSHRECQKGYGTFSEERREAELSTIAFGEYLLSHFESAVSDKEQELQEGLNYELEYIICGMNSDHENVNKVIKKLLLIRMASNYSYIMSDTAMKAEADAMALSVCSVLLLPEITEAVAQVLLLSWAFGESVVDIRSLLRGGKVPFVKTKDTWKTGIAFLLTLGTEKDEAIGNDNQNGLSYKEYLRILLFLEEKTSGESVITMRTLDMLEQRLQNRHGLWWFKADSCISRLEIQSTCNLRRGVTYQFQICFGYR